MWEPEIAKGFVEGALGIEVIAEDQTNVGTDDETTIASESRSAEGGQLPHLDEFDKALRQIEID